MSISISERAHNALYQYRNYVQLSPARKVLAIALPILAAVDVSISGMLNVSLLSVTLLMRLITSISARIGKSCKCTKMVKALCTFDRAVKNRYIPFEERYTSSVRALLRSTGARSLIRYLAAKRRALASKQSSRPSISSRFIHALR